MKLASLSLARLEGIRSRLIHEVTPGKGAEVRAGTLSLQQQHAVHPAPQIGHPRIGTAPYNTGWPSQPTSGPRAGVTSDTGPGAAIKSASPGCTVTADFNRDGQVDFFDYLDYVSAADKKLEAADLDGNGAVTDSDYKMFRELFQNESR